RVTVPAGALPGLVSDHQYDFFVLAGDANRDRKVDFADLVVLAQNYNATGRNWSSGDFNYDTQVEFQDLVTLAQNYNATLPAGAPEPIAASASMTAQSSPVKHARPGTAQRSQGPVKRQSVPLATAQVTPSPFNTRKRIAPKSFAVT